MEHCASPYLGRYPQAQADTKLAILYNPSVTNGLPRLTARTEPLIYNLAAHNALKTSAILHLKQNCQFCINTESHASIPTPTMNTEHRGQMRLYDDHARRLYLNAAELEAFIIAAHQAPEPAKRLALILAYTGMRLSEARTLRFDAVQLERRVLSVRTLKQRTKSRTREIPIPLPLLASMADWQGQPDLVICTGTGEAMTRIAAYRNTKSVMRAAGLQGLRACPKGLRHSFGVKAVMSNVPLNIVQVWMGHTSMATTAIYTTAIGDEQIHFSDRMWGLL